jgi:hypothetical protein
MFGRRRRRVSPVLPAPLPELSDEQVFQLLHGKLAEMIGPRGEWTLVPRRSDDTDVIFHGMKAEEIAATLARVLAAEKAVLRGEHEAEPTALPWTPSPISIWAEPDRATVSAPIELEPSFDQDERARLVA